MLLKQHGFGRVLLTALATSLLTGAVVVAATPALAATSGSLVVADQTVAPGGTITATLTPTIYGAGSGDYAYYCDSYNTPTDTSTGSDGGHSTVLLLISDAGDPTVLPADISIVSIIPPSVSFSGPGEGSFTPLDNVTTPTTLTFTLPSDIPDGVYQAGGGCVSPQNWSVGYDDSYFSATTGLITVSSSTPTPLPDTGVSNSEGAIYGSVAAVALTIGIALVLMRRRTRV